MTDEEEWTCPHCEREENDEPPHCEMEFADGEVTVDVTCESVYLVRDDGYGIALDHDEFEDVIDLYREAKENL